MSLFVDKSLCRGFQLSNSDNGWQSFSVYTAPWYRSWGYQNAKSLMLAQLITTHALYTHICIYTGQIRNIYKTLLKSRHPKSKLPYRWQVVNSRHQTPQGQSVVCVISLLRIRIWHKVVPWQYVCSNTLKEDPGQKHYRRWTIAEPEIPSLRKPK